MNASELEALSTRIMQSWPKLTIPPQVWEESLATFDAGAAGTALVRLRNEQKFPPTVADFIATIRSLGPTGPRRDVHVCERCGNDGLVTMAQMVHGIEYEVMVPCSCVNGTDAQAMLDKIRSANDEWRNGRPAPCDGKPYPRDQRGKGMAHDAIETF